MTIQLLIISIRTESNVTEALSPVGFFLKGAERHKKSHWMGGVYVVGRYMPRYTGCENYCGLYFSNSFSFPACISHMLMLFPNI